MKQHTKVVWLGYASVFFSIVWGIGLVAAIVARRIDRQIQGVGTLSAVVQRDLRGGRLLYRLGFVLNYIVIATIIWIFISTWVF